MERAPPSILYPLAAGAAILALTALAAIFLSDGPAEDTLDRIRRGEPLRIGYTIEAPYAFVAKGGEVTGESPAIAKYVAEKLGAGRLEWRRFEFGSLINGLESGQIDVAAAGMFITRERAERVRFSDPTYRAHPGLLVRTGNPLGLRSYSQAAASGAARIAVLRGSVEEPAFEALGMDSRRLIRVPDAMTGRSAVMTGMADGLALTVSTVRWMAARDISGATEAAHPFEQDSSSDSGYGAFAFRKDDARLTRVWNEVLSGFIGGDEHLALVAPFGFSAEDLPDGATAEEVLSCALIGTRERWALTWAAIVFSGRPCSLQPGYTLISSPRPSARKPPSPRCAWRASTRQRACSRSRRRL
jgi:polar amino acid transport system substrate-binding protein